MRLADSYDNAVNSAAATVSVAAASPLTMIHALLGNGFVPGGR